jgi:hypothetical protein
MFGRIPSWIAPIWIAGTALTCVATAAAAETRPRADPCFLSRNWRGWSAPGDGDVLYLRVNLHDIYRVDLSPGAHVRRFPDYYLINRLRGSDWICSPLDLDLTLSDSAGFEQPLFPRSLRKLTPEEVAAIPRKDLPW